jgi:GNAT superfamily N-acetyltransferase
MSALPEGFVLRPVRDADARGLQDLIGLCFFDYPGCVLDVPNEEPGLRAPATSFEAMWVVERTSDGLIAGCIAAAARFGATPPHAELKKLYVHPTCRGTGLARPLIETMHAWALERGLTRLELWSDTKFTRAHGVYEHFGYRPTGAVRELHDVSLTAEYHFVREA